MGGFNIPLAVNPAPQNPGPMDLAQKGLDVQSLINAVKLQKQTEAQNALAQQSAQIQLKQQQQADEDQQTIRKLAPQFAGKDSNGNGTFDLDGLAQAAQSRGVNPQLVNQMRMQHYQLVEAASKAGSEQLANEQAHNKASYEVLEGLRDIKDPDERLTAANTGLNRLKLMGMDTSHINPQDLLDDKKLDSYESQLGMHGQILADAKTQAETKEKQAEAASKQWKTFDSLGVMVNIETGETRTVAGGVMPPGMLEGKYVAIEQKKALGQPLTAEENAFTKGYEKYQSIKPAIQNYFQQGGPLAPGASPSGPTPPALPGGPGGPTPDQIAEKVKTAPGGWVGPKGETINNVPTQIRGEVQQVLEYRRADPSITARGAVAQPINAWVALLDPQHDATTFGNRNKTLTEFQKDASTGELGAVNTALGHLGELYTAAQALQGGDLPLLHSIANKLGAATGGDAATTYQSILHRVGPEMTKAYLKSGGTEGERGANENDFDIQKGQKQIISNIAESAQLLNSKLASKKQAWETGFQPYRPQDSFENRFLTKDAKDTLGRLSSLAPTNRPEGGGQFSIKAPNGKTYSFKDQQSLDNFKAAAHL